MSGHLASFPGNCGKSPKRLPNAFFKSKSNYETVPSIFGLRRNIIPTLRCISGNMNLNPVSSPKVLSKNIAPEVNWICCQRGAREHYSIPRALDRYGRLRSLITDYWTTPTLSRLIKSGKSRCHPDLSENLVVSFNGRFIADRVLNRVCPSDWYKAEYQQNKLFQQRCVERLKDLAKGTVRRPTVFAFSYAAKEIFQFAKRNGWQTILGQIDPGPRARMRWLKKSFCGFALIGRDFTKLPRAIGGIGEMKLNFLMSS